MKLSGSPILLTGWLGVVGFQFAASLPDFGDAAIVTGRDQHGIDQAARTCRKIHAFKSNVFERMDRAVPQSTGERLSKTVLLMLSNAAE